MSRDEKALGTRVDAETLGRIADAVIALSGPPFRLTKKMLVTNALQFYLVHLEKTHNDGEPFPRAKDRRLTPGVGARNEQSASVGKREATRVASKPRARARARKKRKGNVAQRTRRRGKR